MWADVDTNNDFLNYSEVAELVVDVIKDARMRPVSVGIFGTWGSGKSTLLNLIEQRLGTQETHAGFAIVRFDAWLYQGFDDSRAALMEVIAAALMKSAAGNPGLTDKGRRLLGRVNKMRLLGMTAEAGALAMGVPMFGILNKGIQAAGDFFLEEGDENSLEQVKKAGSEIAGRGKALVDPEKQRTPPKEIADFRAEFEDVLKGLNKTLVVFIDNLDRCLPRQTIQTLEALRLFLFMGRTAFIVAADEEMVRHSVADFFKNLSDRHITDYLDKLIQVPVRVPRLGAQEVRAYLFQLFAATNINIDAKSLEALRSGLESSLQQAWKNEPITREDALRLLGTNPPDEVARGFSIAERIAPMLANSTQVQGNPRIVKRMLNVVRMRARIALRRKMPVDEAMVAKLALFERCTDGAAVAHLYAEINAAAGGKPRVLADLEQLLEEPTKFKEACPEPWGGRAEFVREWLSLEPRLAERDLRPLVYLSRETVPLRALRGNLSAAAAEALRVLMKTTTKASPAGNAAIQRIPDSERTAVMAGVIELFRKHPSWTNKPLGFEGALILARQSPESGALLAAFIRSVTPKLRPWLSVLVKDEDWFKSEEAH